MKFLVIFVVSSAILALTSANEYQTADLMNAASSRSEEVDSDYLERCKKSHEFVGHHKAKNYGTLPPVPGPPPTTYHAAGRGYTPSGPPPAHAAHAHPHTASAYAAPAPIYSAPASSIPSSASLSYSAPAPSIPCSKAIVVSCAPSVAAAPCSAPPATYAY